METFHLGAVAPLLTVEKWKQLFSPDSYKRFSQKDPSLPPEESQKVQEHALKYLIALDQADTTIISYIDSLKMKYPARINSSFGEHKITALHIATMKGCKGVVEKLVASGAEVDCVDQYGWTPLHHAALVSQEIFDFLISKGANQEAKNFVGGTYKDLRKLAGLERAWERDKILYQRLEHSQREEIPIAELEHCTGLQYYSDEHFWPQEYLEALWTMNPEKCDPNNILQCEPWHQLLVAAYRAHKKYSPKLLIKEIKFANSSPSHNKTVGLAAAEFLKGGAVISEYIGRMTVVNEESIPHSFEEYLNICHRFEYLFGNMDASEYGGLARYINDGWPNVFTQLVINENGKDVRSAFVVVDPKGITLDQDILWDYGCGQFSLKWGHYLISDKNQIRSFFKEKKLKQYLNEIQKIFKEIKVLYQQKNKINASQMIEWQCLEMRLSYPLSTPAVLIDLTCSRIIAPEEWRILLEDPFIRKDLDFPPHCEWLDKLLHILDEFHGHIRHLEFSEHTKPLAQAMCHCILTKQDTWSLFQLVKALIVVNQELHMLPNDLKELSIDNMQSAIEGKVDLLSSYNWKEDQEFPFPTDWSAFSDPEYSFTFSFLAE